jgi:hypothetical protein
MTEGAPSVYVYGVIPASDLPVISAAGVQGAAVRAVNHGALAALTSDVHGDALAAAREVRAHWRVLDEASRTTTVLPTRFGTVMESDTAVRERLLEPNSDRLEGLLSELAGCVQLNVKGDYEEGELMREIVTSTPAVAALRKKLRTLPDAAGYYERIRLGELVAADVERRREADMQLALSALAPLAVEAKAEESVHLSFNLAFLVARDRTGEFTDGVNRLVAEFGDRVAIRYVGPLPPYSFADVELDAEAGAWA